MKKVKIVIDKEKLEMLAQGKIKYQPDKKIKFGRWILKEKIGETIGCKSENEDNE